MADNYSNIRFVLFLALLAYAAVPLCFSKEESKATDTLSPYFYDDTCPQAQEIVKSVVEKAIKNDTRMAASLIRLHFHDCFVKGCDASLLLDNTTGITSEKGSNPNKNSALGFNVIDQIKSALEKACPGKVSCADILALAARDSTVNSSGPYWEVALGRRDSTNASLSKSNKNIPPPNITFEAILDKFTRQGLNITDLVALSGSHTIGQARCVSFRQRLYQAGGSKPDLTLNQSYADQLRTRCPRSGGDQNLFPLDFSTPTNFDNSYFKHLLDNKGLLNSDQLLFNKNDKTKNGRKSQELVTKYANDSACFFYQFAISMIKMGNINVLTGSKGEIRKQCSKVNDA